MSRNVLFHALALRVKSSGESNREAWFLTPGEGVVRATVFGGPKSRLRSHVAPFHEGALWIYHDPVRDSRKVSDFDVKSWRPGIRELWERAMAADAVAETILASHGGGGNWEAALELAGAVLDALDGADAGFCARLAVYFLWQWAQLLGVQPDLSVCAACGREAEREERVWYSIRKDALLCEKCGGRGNRSDEGFDSRTGFGSREGVTSSRGITSRRDEGSTSRGGFTPRERFAPRPPDSDAGEAGDESARLRLDPGGRLWLSRIDSLPPAALERVTLDAPSFAQVKALSQAVLAAALGKRLPTWDGV